MNSTRAPTVGIIGYGYVGKAMYQFFKQKYHTVWYDPYMEQSCTKDEINACDLGVVCVMTAANPDGSCDTSIVENTMKWLSTPLILIKSTIPPGTTERLIAETGKAICFSPEYIGESEYHTGQYNFNTEVKNIPFITIGGDMKTASRILNMIVPILGPNKTYHMTTAIAAELAKYMENSYLATKIVFCYEFEQICQKFDVPYHMVRECWLLDPRIGSSHTAIFTSNTTPYSGKCLPKDVKAIIASSTEKGYIPQFLVDVDASNTRIGNLRKCD